MKSETVRTPRDRLPSVAVLHPGSECAYFDASRAHAPAPAVHVGACGGKVRDRVKVPCNGASGDNELRV